MRSVLGYSTAGRDMTETEGVGTVVVATEMELAHQPMVLLSKVPSFSTQVGKNRTESGVLVGGGPLRWKR